MIGIFEWQTGTPRIRAILLLGAYKKHSESTKQIFSEKSKRLWVEKRDEWLTDEVRSPTI